MCLAFHDDPMIESVIVASPICWYLAWIGLIQFSQNLIKWEMKKQKIRMFRNFSGFSVKQ